MNYWEIIADNLKKRGLELGYVAAVDSQGRTIWIADAHRGDSSFYGVLLLILDTEPAFLAKRFWVRFCLRAGQNKHTP